RPLRVPERGPRPPARAADRDAGTGRGPRRALARPGRARRDRGDPRRLRAPLQPRPDPRRRHARRHGLRHQAARPRGPGRHGPARGRLRLRVGRPRARGAVPVRPRLRLLLAGGPAAAVVVPGGLRRAGRVRARDAASGRAPRGPLRRPLPSAHDGPPGARRGPAAGARRAEGQDRGRVRAGAPRPRLPLAGRRVPRAPGPRRLRGAALGRRCRPRRVAGSPGPRRRAVRRPGPRFDARDRHRRGRPRRPGGAGRRPGRSPRVHARGGPLLMDVELRPLSEDDLEQVIHVRATSYGPVADRQRTLQSLGWRMPYSLGAFVGGRLRSMSFMFPLAAWVGGRKTTVAGLSGVATAPEARRQGLVARSLRRWFALLHDQGIGWSAEHPFDPTFYARLGYQTVPNGHTLELPPARLRASTRAGPGRSEGIVAEPVGAEAVADMARVHAAFASRFSFA